ncbi:hypothetical protein [Xanthobacter oligotrophicus]|uniref:hypothetical protein n=1 Tax=Xanthobacter oligotrophicus TaxID=2607286 RepID=UPI0011F12BE2|nr:hypothetical protein [Xanthobacter oligotrophicus]MCG5236695.1 hypothetical protein [Xanthobacter oligotrophicus]
MRAGPAAISAFLFALLAMPAPPVAAQCTLDVRQERDLERDLASGLDAARGKADAVANLSAELGSAGLAGAAPGQGEANSAGAPGLHLSPVSEAFAAHAASPLARSRPDPYRPYQTRPPGAPPLKSDEVAANLKARGFIDVSAVRQRGRSFLAEATGPRGERVRLVLDADSGEINGMQVIGFRPATP